jgi:co-chaperonin GroES (HSP10)
MQAINDYVIVDIIKEGPKKVGGFILTDETDETNRYRKANIISVGEMVAVLKLGIVYTMMLLLVMILVIMIVCTG